MYLKIMKKFNQSEINSKKFCNFSHQGDEIEELFLINDRIYFQMFKV